MTASSSNLIDFLLSTFGKETVNRGSLHDLRSLATASIAKHTQHCTYILLDQQACCVCCAMQSLLLFGISCCHSAHPLLEKTGIHHQSAANVKSLFSTREYPSWIYVFTVTSQQDKGNNITLRSQPKHRDFSNKVHRKK